MLWCCSKPWHNCSQFNEMRWTKCIFYLYSVQPNLLVFSHNIILTAQILPQKQCVMTSPLRRVTSRSLNLHSLYWLPWPEKGERLECEDRADGVKSRKRAILSQRGRLLHSPEILCSYSHSSASHLLCCSVHVFSLFSRSSFIVYYSLSSGASVQWVRQWHIADGVVQPMSSVYADCTACRHFTVTYHIFIYLYYIFTH